MVGGEYFQACVADLDPSLLFFNLSGASEAHTESSDSPESWHLTITRSTGETKLQL